MPEHRQPSPAIADPATNPRSATAFRLPPDLHVTLKRAAAERGVTMNFLVTKLLRESLAWLIPADELRLTREPTRVDIVERCYPAEVRCPSCDSPSPAHRQATSLSAWCADTWHDLASPDPTEGETP